MGCDCKGNCKSDKENSCKQSKEIGVKDLLEHLLMQILKPVNRKQLLVHPSDSQYTTVIPAGLIVDEFKAILEQLEEPKEEEQPSKYRDMYE